MAGNMGNPLLAISEALPVRITEAKAERDGLIARVLELNHEIARLETAAQVASAPPANGTDAKA